MNNRLALFLECVSTDRCVGKCGPIHHALLDTAGCYRMEARRLLNKMKMKKRKKKLESRIKDYEALKDKRGFKKPGSLK